MWNSWLTRAVLGAAVECLAVCAAAPPALQISTETAPAGGWAQIKIYATKPQAIASGHLILSLDPTAFGSGAKVGLFGANGDANGLATTISNQIDVQFSSPTGGIGQLAGLPVMVISVPVLASAAGRTVAVSATSPDSSVTVANGSVTAQGTLSVQKIPAGMGAVPAGTVVPVTGSGFTARTKVTIDGVALSSVNFVSPQEIDVTIGGATELVGKLARVTDGGVEFDYFCFQPNDPVGGYAVPNVQPLFPLTAGTGFEGYNGYLGSAIAVQNPNPTAVSVSLGNLEVSEAPQFESLVTLSIPSGSWGMLTGNDETEFILSASQPVRVVVEAACNLGERMLPQSCPGTYSPNAEAALALVPMSLAILTPSSLAFGWQIGSSTLPAPRNVSATPTSGIYIEIEGTIVTAGSPWLSVTQLMDFGDFNTIAVSVDPTHLAIGTYQGSISVAQNYGPPGTLPVSLTVTAAPVPTISAAPASLTFNSSTPASPFSEAISVGTNSGPAAFTVTTNPGTWLKISPMSGTTPAVLTVTWDPSVLMQSLEGELSTAAGFSISGLGNEVDVPVTFNFTGIQVSLPTYGQSALVFSAQAGTPSQTQTIYGSPAGNLSASADQPWLSAAVTGQGASQSIIVTANPAGLAPGVYTGNVTLASPGVASATVPVTLAVWSTPPPLTVTPSSFTFVQMAGEPAPLAQYAQASSGGIPVPLTLLYGANWLGLASNMFTPSPIQVSVSGPQTPGQYNGSFTVQSPGNSAYVPVTLLVEPSPATPPALSAVVNAASGFAGAVSPGEILTIRGYSAGAGMVGGLTLTASGTVATSLNGLQVTFDGKPAPLIYTSANQTNLIVPYEVAGKTSTVMQLVYATAAGAMATASWTLPVAASAPGIFTVDSTGTGQGAIVNQEGSVNSATNPAARGSVISIYATGEGQTSPPGVTGSVTKSNATAPLLPVTVTIGGSMAVVQYASEAPGEVAGVLQVNAVVPQSIAPGAAVPVAVSVGGVASQANVTISVK